MSTVVEHDVEHIRVIEFNHPSEHNPFSAFHEENIKRSLKKANDDPSVKAVVVTGHNGRSFSAGGDFAEVKELTGGADVDCWIDRVTDLYASALQVEKPMVAAVSGYAIGMGFQMAMMFDWRIMSATAEFRMPELKHGIGCSVGGAILGHILDYNAMLEIIYSCESIGPEKALAYRLVKEVTNESDLVPRAIEIARMLAEYPSIPFINTKRTVTAGLLKVLYESSTASKATHRAAFAARSPQSHFKNILREKYDARSSSVNMATS